MSKTNVLLVYASRHGQARKIADRVAATLRKADLEVDVYNASALPARQFDLAPFQAAVVVASIQMGKHEREMIAFVRGHRETLQTMPTAFLSVSGAEASVENSEDPEARRRAGAHVREYLDAFVAATGWHPTEVHPIAGALRYREYGFFVRLIMRLISRRTGLSTDTSRDHEYTDWPVVDQIATSFARNAVTGSSGGESASRSRSA